MPDFIDDPVISRIANANAEFSGGVLGERKLSTAVGDLLTTSDTIGHAVKATDPLAAFGAVLGKALRLLDRGRGSISVLIAFQ